MTYTKAEELAEIRDEVKDCEKAVKTDTEVLKDAQECLWKSKVYLAEAIIKLNNFEKSKKIEF